MTKLKLEIALVALDTLIAYERNARTHSAEQIDQLAASIREFGWTNPVLADGSDVVAGHGRMAAARQLYDAGETIRLPGGQELPAGTVPVLDCSGMSEEQRRAYILADNQLGLNAGWDEELLKAELVFLDQTDFDFGLIGLPDDELTRLLAVNTVPINSSSDGSRSGSKSLYLTVGEHKITLTEDEHKRFVALIEQYVEANGATYGFAASVLERLGEDAVVQ